MFDGEPYTRKVHVFLLLLYPHLFTLLCDVNGANQSPPSSMGGEFF